MEKVFLKEEDENKEFSVSLAVFNVFKSRWKDRKKDILLIIDDDPSRSDEVNTVIKNAEEGLDYFTKAASRYSLAARAAKEKYDELKKTGISSGDKILDFFGFTEKGKDFENKPMFVLKDKEFILPPQGTEPNLSIKQVLNFDNDLVPFTDNENPKIAKKQVLKMLSYKKLSSKKSEIEIDEDGLDKLTDSLKNFDVEAHFQSWLTEQDDNNENLKKIEQAVIAKARETMVKYIKIYNKNRNPNNTFKLNLIKQYSKEPAMMVFYQFGTNKEKMEQDPFLAATANKSVSYDSNEVQKYLIDIFSENEIKYDKTTLSDIVAKKDWDGFKNIFSSIEKPKEKPKEKVRPNPEQIREFVSHTRGFVAEINKDPSVFFSGTEGEGLDRINVIKVRDVYRIGNQFFEDLNEKLKDREYMNIMVGAIQTQPNDKAFMRFDLNKIKEVYEVFPKIPEQKIIEMKKDMERLVDNEDKVEPKPEDVYEESDWKELKASLDSNDSERLHASYKLVYEWFSEYKKEFIKFLHSDTDTPEAPTPEPEQPKDPEGKITKDNFVTSLNDKLGEDNKLTQDEMAVINLLLGSNNIAEAAEYYDFEITADKQAKTTKRKKGEKSSTQDSDKQIDLIVIRNQIFAVAENKGMNENQLQTLRSVIIKLEKTEMIKAFYDLIPKDNKEEIEKTVNEFLQNFEKSSRTDDVIYYYNIFNNKMKKLTGVGEAFSKEDFNKRIKGEDNSWPRYFSNEPDETKIKKYKNILNAVMIISRYEEYMPQGKDNVRVAIFKKLLKSYNFPPDFRPTEKEKEQKSQSKEFSIPKEVENFEPYQSLNDEQKKSVRILLSVIADAKYEITEQDDIDENDPEIIKNKLAQGFRTIGVYDKSAFTRAEKAIVLLKEANLLDVFIKLINDKEKVVISIMDKFKESQTEKVLKMTEEEEEAFAALKLKEFSTDEAVLKESNEEQKEKQYSDAELEVRGILDILSQFTNFRDLDDKKKITITNFFQRLAKNKKGSAIKYFSEKTEKQLGITGETKTRIQNNKEYYDIAMKHIGRYFQKYRPIFDELQKDPPVFKEKDNKVDGLAGKFAEKSRNMYVQLYKKGMGTNNKSRFNKILTAMINDEPKAAYEQVQSQKENPVLGFMAPFDALESYFEYLNVAKRTKDLLYRADEKSPKPKVFKPGEEMPIIDLFSGLKTSYPEGKGFPRDELGTATIPDRATREAKELTKKLKKEVEGLNDEERDKKVLEYFKKLIGSIKDAYHVDFTYLVYTYVFDANLLSTKNNQEIPLRLQNIAHRYSEGEVRKRDPQDDEVPEEEKIDILEKLTKLIKPLIREKLKRKQNGKKNLRN